MTRLSTFPRGLLSLVGAQNFGENPRDLSEVVSPTVDLSDLYAVSLQGIETVNPGNAIAGVTGTVFQVPTGETWIIRGADVRMAPGVGASVAGFGLVITSQGPTGNAALFCGDKQAAAASTINWSTLDYPDLILKGGDGLGYYAEGVVGAVPVFVTVAAVRLKA